MAPSISLASSHESALTRRKPASRNSARSGSSPSARSTSVATSSGRDGSNARAAPAVVSRSAVAVDVITGTP